ncbi:MAG TPA: hypothetical protein VF337_09195 [Candidatus Limnocylindrales bacterium]
MGAPTRTIRGLMALGLAVGLVAAFVAACGSSGLGGHNGSGSSLPSGLESNLDELDSYQFQWQDTSDLSTALATDAGALQTSGIVINGPAKSYMINALGMIQVIVIGSKGWMSHDNGATWKPDTAHSADSSALLALLPYSAYGSVFDTNAAEFIAGGSENKNGIDCIHYTPSADLRVVTNMAWPHAAFRADLWVASGGNYPVSGFYGWSGTPGVQLGSWGYSFEITNVDDSGNKVAAPTT